MDLGLRGVTAVITGGSTGMGMAFSERFASEGANVAINYIVGPDEAKALAKRLGDEYGVRAIAVYADVSDEAQVESMMQEIHEEFSRIDILVNNAGVWPTDDLMDISVDNWRRVIDINLNGAFICGRAAARYMIKSERGGHIVNIGSKSGISVSSGGHAHYATSKGGVTLLTKSMARELTGRGVIVNCVIPGMVATPMNQDKRDDPQMNEYYIKRLPMGRFSQPEDIAGAVAFMASHRAEFTAGSIFDITGGLLL
jgi:3-oxoacyl-[acyl-carrier protein] reductase